MKNTITNYTDKLQAKIEAKLLKSSGYKLSRDQLIAIIMLEENLFYTEASNRYDQAIGLLQQANSKQEYCHHNNWLDTGDEDSLSVMCTDCGATDLSKATKI